MTFDWWTFALQTINFLVLVWLLQRLLYRPVLDVIARRKAMVEEAFADAKAHQQAADEERSRFEQSQSELTASRQELLSRAHAEIEADRARMLEEARAQANKLLDDSRERLAAERTAAIADARAEIADLAVQMAAGLLDDIRSTGTDQLAWSRIFRTQMLERIAQLTQEERATLESDLGPDGAEISIVTAQALPDAEQAAWREALGQYLPTASKFAFSVDAELLGGAELHFPHAVLSLAWSEMLQRARARLLTHDNAH